MLNIREGMVEYIVFLLPEELIRSENIHSGSHECIDPFFRRIGSMCPIMHDIESDEYRTLSEEECREECHPEILSKKDQKYITRKKK